MKQTTQNILNWLNNKNFENQCDLMFKNSVGFTELEMTIDEAFEEFNSIKDTLNKIIEKDVIDKLSFNKRNLIYSQLSSISNSSQQLQNINFNLNQNRNIGKNIFTYIITLKDALELILINNKSEPFYNYVEETKELSKLKKTYNHLIKDIDTIEENKNKTITSSKELTQKIEELNLKTKEFQNNIQVGLNLNTQINNLYNKITANAQDIESKKLTINSLHNSAKELENIFEQSNSKVKDIIDKTEIITKDFLDNKKIEFTDIISELTTKNSDIQIKNIELQKRINELLQGANAGRLHKSFYLRKRQLEKNQKWWFTGIIIINVSIVLFSLLIINGSKTLGINSINPNKLDSAFYIKLFISIPLIFLDWFFIHQYNTRKDLIEKYSFKSVLALSLLAYNEMILENYENKNSIDFISKTVDKIYESPFDTKNLSKKELDIFNKLAEKGLDQIYDIIKGTINKVPGE
jgi:hypothetical protein